MRTSLFAAFAELWRNLTVSQKAAMIVASVILTTLIIIAVSLASPPRFTPLYDKLSDEDAAAVVQKLKDQKVTYHISGRGVIEVPENKVNELRMTLAGEGIPRSDGTGFELFDKAQFGQSEFGERLNYVRALQTELARTISQLESVRTVRVHLVIPERRLFETNQHVASASVVLGLKKTFPTQREIKSIIHLVSTAVEGLDPANVTVVDTTGNLLSDVVNSETAGSDSRLQDQRVAETQIETRLQGILDRVLGPDKAVVRANVKLTYDRRRVDREVYHPIATAGDGAERGVLESQHQATETYNGNNKPTSSLTAAVLPPATVPSSANGYNRTENTNQYRVSK